MLLSACRPNILFIATRDPRGQLTGRKTVLRTIISSLESAGYGVIVAYFGSSIADPSDVPTSVDKTRCTKYIQLPKPDHLDFALALATGFLTGRRSLNECLYWGRKPAHALRDLALAEGAKVVVTDMIRTAPYGQKLQVLGLPWIADLDDLLSRRYEQLAAKDRAGRLLGYHEAPLLHRLTALLHPVMRVMLRREARILEHRERAVARAANTVTLVNPAEASCLSKAAGVSVEWMPMAITGPDSVAPIEHRCDDAVFVGGLSYQPNLDAMLDFDRRVMPELVRAGIMDFRLDVIGEADPRISKGFSSAVHTLGYVDDLDAALQRYRMMLVPGRLSGGIKTKMIHAALNRLIILATPEAVYGTGLQAGREILVWKDGKELATLISRVRRGDTELDVIRTAALVWAETQFSPAALTGRWLRHVQAVMEAT